jgi:hypothetical protein
MACVVVITTHCTALARRAMLRWRVHDCIAIVCFILIFHLLGYEISLTFDS